MCYSGRKGSMVHWNEMLQKDATTASRMQNVVAVSFIVLVYRFLFAMLFRA